MARSRRAPREKSRDARADQLRAPARAARGDRASTRGGRPGSGRGAQAVRRGGGAAAPGARASHGGRGEGQAGPERARRQASSRGLRRLAAHSSCISPTHEPAWTPCSSGGAPAPTGSGPLPFLPRCATACSRPGNGSGRRWCSPPTRPWAARHPGWTSSRPRSQWSTRIPWCTTTCPAWTTTICAGGMIGGQALDLEAEGRRLPMAALADVHGRKTGALIAAACVIGGLAAGGTAAWGESLRGYGADVGLAFQIYDDVLDATATSAQLGKTAGKDAAHAKSTFVTLLGVGAARAEAERLAARAVDRLRQAGLVSPTLVELAHYIVTRPN